MDTLKCIEDQDSDIASQLDLFIEPPDYYPPSPPPTTENYTLRSGQNVSVSLVGHNPLWGHHLWNAGRLISSYLETHAELVHGRTVLELGAGAGLPSLVCAHLGAECIVVTDYPDVDLLANLQRNVDTFHDQTNSKDSGRPSKLIVEGFCWGRECQNLLEHLPSSKAMRESETEGFDLLILADLLFNHSEHAKLVAAVTKTLKKDEMAKALVFFTPYRPWLLEKDLAFFDQIREAGMSVEKIFEKKMEKVMFEEDRGDEELRKTVFGYQIKWII
ncbi:hypothetical protein K3495_g441 [Podosphaera aphanis]|nr:hypothetical protein K3495_g441 [Podosphaera aphanis]